MLNDTAGPYLQSRPDWVIKKLIQERDQEHPRYVIYRITAATGLWLDPEPCQSYTAPVEETDR